MPDEAARVGIVLRTKNRPWFLRRALVDIVRQELDDWKVHIVNDGGDPGDVERAVAELSPDARARISSTHNPASLGRSTAANQGVQALATEFLVLHDDDDQWHRSFLAATVGWLDAHAVDIGVVVRTEVVYEQEDPDRPGEFVVEDRLPFWPGLTDITYTDLLAINRAVPISFLYRRGVHDEVGLYRADIEAAEDWEFNLRVALHHHIGFLDGEPLAYWMHRVGVAGESGNSMFTLADEHSRFDRLIRDEALRAYAAQHGPGLALYLSRYIPDVVREEVTRQLDARPSDGQRIARRLRGIFRGRR